MFHPGTNDFKCASKFWVSTLWSSVNATYNLAVISIFAFKYLLNITTQNATCILCNQMVFIHVIPNTHFAPSMAWPGIPVDFSSLSWLISLWASWPSWIAELLGMWYLEGWLCHSDATLMSKKNRPQRLRWRSSQRWGNAPVMNILGFRMRHLVDVSEKLMLSVVR